MVLVQEVTFGEHLMLIYLLKVKTLRDIPLPT